MDNSTNNIKVPENRRSYNRGIIHKNEIHSLSETVSSSKQNLLYILNTTFLVIIAFIAGYNLNSWQMKKNISNAVTMTEMYLQKAKENYKNSEQLLLSMRSQGNTHFEGIINKKPGTSSTESTLSTSIQLVKRPIQKKEGMPANGIRKSSKNVEQKILPLKKIPGIKILHTIKEGELLSSLVRKAAMADFLKDNPQISNPDRIYPGQKIYISIPEQSIQTGSYLNNYFIRPVKNEAGKNSYMLTKTLNIPEPETLISYIVKQSKKVITRTTTPYINLSDFTDTMKEEIWGTERFLQTKGEKIGTIIINQTGTYFETINKHPIFNINTYKGLRSIRGADYHTHIDNIKDYLIKYIASTQTNTPINPIFHFLIFGETIVQVKYLETTTFIEGPNKSKILIGIVYRNSETKNALLKLQSTLTTCKSRQGEIIEITQDNFIKYQ